MQDLFVGFPLVALAPCGLVFTHGAPAAEIDSLDDVEAASVSDVPAESIFDVMSLPVVGPLLWARSATPGTARRFLEAVGARVAIFGHDVVPSGYERIGDEQINLSTSFGVPDGNKYYLDVDLARRYEARGTTFADLVQEGNLGLMRAADKFDPRRNIRFSTYAAFWIRQALQRSLAHRQIRLPLYVAEDRRRVLRARRRLTMQHHREVSANELALASGLPLARVGVVQLLPDPPAKPRRGQPVAHEVRPHLQLLEHLRERF
jgi:RNA polymerase sigma factor (sigma-70 family)